MANRVKGEINLPDGNGGQLTLRLDMNAMAEFEAETGAKFFEYATNPASSAQLLRHLVWAGLRQVHPDITLQEAGRVASIEVLSQALIAAMPDAAEPAQGNAAAG